MEEQLNPEVIYRIIATKLEIPATSICILHAPCNPTPSCNLIQTKEVLNFDLVETKWHQKSNSQTTDSVDALTYTPRKLCLVELKGWKKFLEYQEIAQKNEVTEWQKNVLNKRIDKQNRKYKLQDKLLESIHICEEITRIENIKKLISIVYILVTDVDPYKNAAVVLTQQLNMLANTATDWETVCTSKMKQHLKTETEEIKDIKTAFIFCKDFDKFITSEINN